MKKWFAKIGVEEFKLPAPWPHPYWDELEHRPPHPTSVPALTNSHVAKWAQILTTMLQHILESLPWRKEFIITAKGEYNWNRMFNKQIYNICDLYKSYGQGYKNLGPYSVFNLQAAELAYTDTLAKNSL